MADDWLSAAVDGMSLENGLDTSGGDESPSLVSNISQLLRSTRRDRADIEARLAQLRRFIQQTDEVMRGIVESGDQSLAAKYSNLAGTRRGLEQNAAHLQELLAKVTESETRARHLAERGRQLQTDEAAVETAEPAGDDASRPHEWPDHEQKVAVVRGRPGPVSVRKRDAGDGALLPPDWGATRAPADSALQEWGAPRAPSELSPAPAQAAHMDRLLRALRGEPSRAAPLAGAEAALRDKAAELDATRQRLNQLRQLMSAVQESRTTGDAAADAAPAELRALLGDVESALDATEDEPHRHCDDCRAGPRSLPAGRDPPPSLPPPLLACRRAGSLDLAPPDRQRPARAASATPMTSPATAADGDVRSQLQQVTAMVQALTRQPWSPQPGWPPVYQPPLPGYQVAGWSYPPHPPPPPAPPAPQQADMQHQQTLSALSQCFQLLQNQQQQIRDVQRQMQTTAAAVAAVQQPPLTAPQPVTSAPHAPPPPPPPPPPPFLSPALLRVDEPAGLALADGFAPPAAGASMLNNQVAPGSRANNYWDNFRSYSRQNLLSGGSEPEERPRGDSESVDDARAEGFMARPRAKKQKVNKENQQLERSLSNTRPGVAGVEPVRPRVHRAATPQNNPQVDAIYSCVNTLIAQNQEQPEFLIELLHDLQLVRSERQRRQVLLAVQSVVVQEVSGARHKQRNRGAPAAPAPVHHALLTAEREEAKTTHHLVTNKHTKNLSHSQLRAEPADAAAADPQDTTVAKNLAPVKNAAAKNTAKPKTFEPAVPLDDPELQLARVLHEMNVFLSDHHAGLLSPVLLARLERLLLRACGQSRGPPPASLNRLLEEAMVPFMGQPVSEAGGRLVQAVLERVGAALRGRDLVASPPAAEPPPLGSESDDEEERADRADVTPGHLETADDGPQVIPEQEVPSLNGRELADHLDRRPSDLSDTAATYRSLGTPRDTPEPAADPLSHECPEAAETDACGVRDEVGISRHV